MFSKLFAAIRNLTKSFQEMDEIVTLGNQKLRERFSIEEREDEDQPVLIEHQNGNGRTRRETAKR